MHGARVVRDIFEQHNTPALRGHVIWTPMLPADNSKAAQVHKTCFQDEQIQHYWDPDIAMGAFLSETMGLVAPVAWDVYLVCAPGTPWDEETPPRPVFWMHQLGTEDPSLYLNLDVLRQQVVASLDYVVPADPQK